MPTSRETLRQIPKAELHRHLECSMRLGTLKDLAHRAGIEVPHSEAAFKAKFLVTEPMHDLASVLNKFLVTQQVLDNEEALTRITFECIEDAVSEGTRILELRYAPTFVQQGHPHLSFESIHGAIVKGMRMAEKLPIAVGLIAIIQRTLSLQDAARVTDFAIENQETFVGLDLADNEAGFDAKPFAKMFERARQSGLGITVHAGESDYPGAVQAVIDAVERLGARRIGHGVQVHRDPKAMQFLKDRGIPLEICPTSNWLTNAVPSVKAHPFKKLLDAGVPVTINTDDPGVFGIDLLHEYEILDRDHGLSREQFDRCNDVAAAASFIPYSQKQKAWPRPIPN